MRTFSAAPLQNDHRGETGTLKTSGFPINIEGMTKMVVWRIELGRLAKFSHGNHARIFDSNLYPNPARPRSGPMKFWGTCLGLR